MTSNDAITLLVAMLAVVVSFVSLYRTRKVSERQLELQEKQASYERESARLAKLHREELELADKPPSLATSIHNVTIHYDDGDIQDTVAELELENHSSKNRSLNRCVVGLLEKPTDIRYAIGREAQHQDRHATYPVALPPHSSLILYSFGRHIEEAYRQCFGPSASDEKVVVVFLSWAGIPDPISKVIGTFRPERGLSERHGSAT